MPWHGEYIGIHTRVITTGIEIPGQFEALFKPDSISVRILIIVTMRKGDTYTVIAPILSHRVEKMKSPKVSKAGVDRKTLGMCGESSPSEK